MSTQNEFIVPEQPAGQEPQTAPASSALSVRKDFVEPEISVPVDVLEATTFFNTSTSGVPIPN